LDLDGSAGSEHFNAATTPFLGSFIEEQMSAQSKYAVSRPHPWHGLPAGPNIPEVVTAYIEITQTDEVKYEVCKDSGYLKVDRAFRATNFMPTIYGFIPQTYCGEAVRALAPQATEGDGDPLDIVVISERRIERSDILLDAVVIGGLQMIDGGEADDKIVAVLKGDPVWGNVTDISELPEVFVERLRHYFETYKFVPGKPAKNVSIDLVYGRAHAFDVIRASMEDYKTLIAK